MSCFHLSLAKQSSLPDWTPLETAAYFFRLQILMAGMQGDQTTIPRRNRRPLHVQLDE